MAKEGMDKAAEQRGRRSRHGQEEKQPKEQPERPSNEQDEKHDQNEQHDNELLSDEQDGEPANQEDRESIRKNDEKSTGEKEQDAAGERKKNSAPERKPDETSQKDRQKRKNLVKDLPPKAPDDQRSEKGQQGTEKESAESKGQSEDQKSEQDELRKQKNLSDLAKEINEQLSQDLHRAARPEDVRKEKDEQISERARKALHDLIEKKQKEKSPQEKAQQKKPEQKKPEQKKENSSSSPDSPKDSSKDASKGESQDSSADAEESSEDSSKDPQSDQLSDETTKEILNRMKEIAQRQAEDLQAGEESKSSASGKRSESGGEGEGQSESGKSRKGGNSDKGGEPAKGKGSAKEQEQGSEAGSGEVESAKGQSRGEGDSTRRKGHDGQLETQRQDGSQVDGSDGQVEGGGHGSKELTAALKDILRNLKSDDQKKRETDYSKVDRARLEQEMQNKKFDQILDRKRSREKDPSGERGSGQGSWQGSEQGKERERPEKPRSQNTEHHLNQILQQTWFQLLGQYQNSDRLLKQLAEFSSTCQSFAVREPRLAHVLKQYAGRASELSEILRKLDVQYRDFEEFAFSLTGGRQQAQAIRRIRYLERVLSAKQDAGGLNAPEERALETAKAILAAVERFKEQPSSQEAAQAFRDQLLGPLSRRAIENNYPPADSRQDIDADALVDAMRKGAVSDLAVYSKLSPFVNILLNDMLKPTYYERHEGELVPRNEADASIERADDFEDIPYIIKEGNPPELEILRLMSGDLLKETFREKVRKSDPKKPYPKRASIVLYDISGSMSSQQKQVIRNAIVNAFVDRSQTDVARGEGEHTLYMIPFDALPHEPRRISNLQQAQQFFDDMRARPLGSGGDDSITEGMVKAYELIAEHQANGGELERANILLITDAVANINFNKIETARAKVDPEVDLALNAITVGDWNRDVSEMIRRYAINGNGEIGKVSHQHIPYDEINRLLDGKSEIGKILTSAQDYSQKLNHSVPNLVLDQIRGSVLGMANDRDSREKQQSVQLEKWVRKLKSLTPSQGPGGPAGAMIDHFMETTVGMVGKEWSADAKVSSWQHFLGLVEEKGMTAEEFLASLNAQQIGLFLRWLEK
ncbi:MAG: hypothetical protein C5B49_14765 [Bdellovibrio sp.]|nr:MAG: hypothetical protein C5B49_14765 [Bdellovibrio sp.]